MPSKNRSGDGYSETPSFVRNVMGSSAGAGSGEFHVYRHLRRKEYARQKQIQQQSVQVCWQPLFIVDFELSFFFIKNAIENKFRCFSKWNWSVQFHRRTQNHL